MTREERRDLFAAHALQGLLATNAMVPSAEKAVLVTKAAVSAWLCADAMLENDPGETTLMERARYLSAKVIALTATLQERTTERDAIRKEYREEEREWVASLAERTTERDAERATVRALTAEIKRLREQLEQVSKVKGISHEWVLMMLAGQRFPGQGEAYDFMRRMMEPPESAAKAAEGE